MQKMEIGCETKFLKKSVLLSTLVSTPAEQKKQKQFDLQSHNFDYHLQTFFFLLSDLKLKVRVELFL